MRLEYRASGTSWRRLRSLAPHMRTPLYPIDADNSCGDPREWPRRPSANARDTSANHGQTSSGPGSVRGSCILAAAVGDCGRCHCEEELVLSHTRCADSCDGGRLRHQGRRLCGGHARAAPYRRRGGSGHEPDRLWPSAARAGSLGVGNTSRRAVSESGRGSARESVHRELPHRSDDARELPRDHHEARRAAAQGRTLGADRGVVVEGEPRYPRVPASAVAGNRGRATGSTACQPQSSASARGGNEHRLHPGRRPKPTDHHTRRKHADKPVRSKQRGLREELPQR